MNSLDFIILFIIIILYLIQELKFLLFANNLLTNTKNLVILRSNKIYIKPLSK
jgi:hypothetical protein